MTSHSFHEDSHEAGLADDCPRCQEHALEPTGLDAQNLRRIWEGPHHTATDLKAFNTLYRSVVTTQRLGEAYAVAAWRSAGGSVATMSDGPDLADFAKPDAFELFDHGGRL